MLIFSYFCLRGAQMYKSLHKVIKRATQTMMCYPCFSCEGISFQLHLLVHCLENYYGCYKLCRKRGSANGHG